MIIFVDDEPMFVHYYLKHLRDSFSKEKVIFCETITEAREAIKKFIGELEILIIDIMMPPEPGFEQGTEGGLLTGLVFLEQIASKLREQNIPVLVLTNRDPGKIIDIMTVLTESLPGLVIKQKSETPAFILPSIVSRIIKHHESGG